MVTAVDGKSNTQHWPETHHIGDRAQENYFKKGQPVRSSGVIINQKWRKKSIEVKKKLSSDFSHNFQHKLLLEQHRQNFRKLQNGWKRGNQNVFQDGWKSDSDVRVDWREDVAAWDSGPRGAWKLEPLGYVALEFCVGRHYSPVRSFHLSHTNHHERRIFFPPTFTIIPINFLSLNWIKISSFINEAVFAHLSLPWSIGWVALSFLFVRLFGRCPAMGTSPLLLAPDPQTHTFSESLW